MVWFGVSLDFEFLGFIFEVLSVIDFWVIEINDLCDLREVVLLV